MIGKMLGNRYDIVQKVGTGGMSDVYKARCIKLNRYVAIKILKQEFAENEEFIKSFKIEAQAAASLTHPNIVSIYDVGNHNELNYIVMEYVEGITLKEYILKKGKLSWRESVNIAIQICSALEVAHKNGIVHRDVKPQNIIINEEGVAKVTDFGIAKAATYFTVAYTGNAIGSVHYFSPEQARGGYTDNKSDLYSLGVVLYEMLTGTLPFEGDTPVAIAYKHIEQKPTPPIEINDQIPIALNNIVLKAMYKNNDKRFANATEMIDSLREVFTNPSNQSIQLNQEKTSNDSPTIVIPAVITNSENNLDDDLEEQMISSKKSNSNKKKVSKLSYVFALMASLAIIIIVTFFGYKIFFAGHGTASEVAVPNLVGKNIDEARMILSQNNLSLKVTESRSDENVEAGKILEQYPSIGINVKIPNEVEVTVSTGTKLVKIPDIEKKDYREAKVTIENLGLTAEMVNEPSDEIPIDFVIGTNPIAGTTVEKDQKVQIIVSKGPEDKVIQMFSLIGKTQYEAKELLEAKNLKIGNVAYEESSKSYGTIIKQSIKENEEISEGSFVDITLSTGKAENLSKQIQLDISLPKDREEVEVEVVYINDKGNRNVVYPKTDHKTSKPLTIQITGEGKGKIKVYFDGILDFEDEINFEGDV